VGGDTPNRTPARDRPGRRGVTGRCVVPWKPGNAGGGKAPDFGRAVAATTSPGMDRPISQPRDPVPRSRKEIAGPVKPPPSGAGVGRPAKSVGEPEAVNPHVRFAERAVATEQGMRC
jgi:hypothetical protein